MSMLLQSSSGPTLTSSYGSDWFSCCLQGGYLTCICSPGRREQGHGLPMVPRDVKMSFLVCLRRHGARGVVWGPVTAFLKWTPDSRLVMVVVEVVEEDIEAHLRTERCLRRHQFWPFHVTSAPLSFSSSSSPPSPNTFLSTKNIHSMVKAVKGIHHIPLCSFSGGCLTENDRKACIYSCCCAFLFWFVRSRCRMVKKKRVFEMKCLDLCCPVLLLPSLSFRSPAFHSSFDKRRVRREKTEQLMCCSNWHYIC